MGRSAQLASREKAMAEMVSRMAELERQLAHKRESIESFEDENMRLHAEVADHEASCEKVGKLGVIALALLGKLGDTPLTPYQAGIIKQLRYLLMEIRAA